MPRASLPTGVELEYETFGSSTDPTLLLVMGFTAQMTAWDDDFCRMLADGGLHVVRFDNRDCGLSTKFDGQQVDLPAVMAAALSEQPIPAVPYTLSGGTDAKAFARLGIECYGFSPLQMPAGLDYWRLFHGVDERVPVDGLRFGVRVLDRFLRSC